MCFSAAASFIAGWALSGGGLYAISNIKNKKYLPLAAVPLLFGLQQLAEGGVWMWLNGHIGQQALTLFIYIFLFFSQIFRVIWTPFIAWYIESKPVKKKIIARLFMLWVILAWYLAYTLLVTPVYTYIHEHHIVYDYEPLIVSLKRLSVAAYMIVTLVPLFMSSMRIVKMLGILLFVSAAISYAFYTEAFVSVRCFFAALISVYIIYAMRRQSVK